MTTQQHFLSFANAAERDAYWPAANTNVPLGALCVTLDNQAVWELNDRTGARRWTPPWNTAWGSIAGAINGTMMQNITGLVNVPGLDLTLAWPAARKLRVEIALQAVANSVAGNGAGLYLNQDGSQMRNVTSVMPTAGIGVAMLLATDVVMPASGSTRILAQVANYAGGVVTINVTGQFTGASFIAAYDIGPNTIIPA